MKLAEKLKQVLFCSSSQPKGDYPLFLEKVLFFFHDFFHDDHHLSLHTEKEKQVIRERGLFMLTSSEQALPKFCKQFYNRRIEDLYGEFLRDQQEMIPSLPFTVSCLQWFISHEQIQLQVSRELADCVLYECLLHSS
jgi:hypothetical protein